MPKFQSAKCIIQGFIKHQTCFEAAVTGHRNCKRHERKTRKINLFCEWTHCAECRPSTPPTSPRTQQYRKTHAPFRKQPKMVEVDTPRMLFSRCPWRLSCCCGWPCTTATPLSSSDTGGYLFDGSFSNSAGAVSRSRLCLLHEHHQHGRQPMVHHRSPGNPGGLRLVRNLQLPDWRGERKFLDRCLLIGVLAFGCANKSSLARFCF